MTALDLIDGGPCQQTFILCNQTRSASSLTETSMIGYFLNASLNRKNEPSSRSFQVDMGEEHALDQRLVFIKPRV
jgi:hypothetical protein